jgi:serine/threonine protein kinase
MIDARSYIKIIDFGEAKIVDNYDEESKMSAGSYGNRYETSSDGDSYFGRMLNKKSVKKKRKHNGTFVGTPLYCAPEMLELNQSGLFSDLWALGVIIYEMGCGQKMFKGKNNKDIFDKILKKDVFYPWCLDPDMIDLIEKLTNLDPLSRLGLKSVHNLKKHPFFEGVDFEAIQTQ